MTGDLGRRLKVRSLVYVAGEKIPYFWPMRAFIHHNPLHGFEDLPFPEAVRRGEALFHARGYLPRHEYQRYLREGRIDEGQLREEIRLRLGDEEAVLGIPLSQWAEVAMTRLAAPLDMAQREWVTAEDVAAALQGGELPRRPQSREALWERLKARYLSGMPLYEALDRLHGLSLGEELDELVIKSCLDFFDEGQSVWEMPNREKGFFAAWRELALHNGRLYLKGLHIDEVVDVGEPAEQAVIRVMEMLGVPESLWLDYLRREIARLHGWAGFIRWRSAAEHYHWTEKYPADLVEYVAVRLSFSAALLHEVGRRGLPATYPELERWVEASPEAAYLRAEWYGRTVVPDQAQRLEEVLELGRPAAVTDFFADYVQRKQEVEAQAVAQGVRSLAQAVGVADRLGELGDEALSRLLQALERIEEEEGLCWLRAMESRAAGRLLQGVQPGREEQWKKRPFAQALFCIDTRSERIRRQLEGAGDYQTFGIAGFFGVPLSFIAMDKGNEIHLCPVLLTPRNVVLEVPVLEYRDPEALTVLGKVLHELKESILTPFVTVEAIGLLFGFDMFGKTFFPETYGHWRKHLEPQRGLARLLVDKLSRERADSVVRAVHRAIIEKALEHELGVAPELIHDDLVKALREAAMADDMPPAALYAGLSLDEATMRSFVRRLREAYHIRPDAVRLQMERLGRIGFSLEEQVGYVAQALRSIGLTEGFSRFVLLIGHGSSSENNPYESALDCGACGGNHGLINARVFAQMANRPEVRRRLRDHGIQIPDDTWFIPALHDTTTDEIRIADVELVPASHLIYIDRLRNGLATAARLCAAERMPTLTDEKGADRPERAVRLARRNSLDWSQVRPEWGLSGNAYFIIGRRALTRELKLEGRAFLHSYDYRLDENRRLLENIFTGPLVVGQWINMEHYFSTVDNERFGSGSKVYHNVAGRFGVMTGNLSDLRTGLPSQTVLKDGRPYHEPLRLITLVEAPLEHAREALAEVASVRQLVRNGWIRFLVLDPQTRRVWECDRSEWLEHPAPESWRAEQRTQAEAS